MAQADRGMARNRSGDIQGTSTRLIPVRRPSRPARATGRPTSRP